MLAMHPAVATTSLPVAVELARRGHHVMACNSRYVNNDSVLLMEKVLWMYC